MIIKIIIIIIIIQMITNIIIIIIIQMITNSSLTYVPVSYEPECQHQGLHRCVCLQWIYAPHPPWVCLGDAPPLPSLAVPSDAVTC